MRGKKAHRTAPRVGVQRTTRAKKPPHHARRVIKGERAADLAHPATLVPHAPPPPPPVRDGESERKEEREVRQQTGEGQRLLSACAGEVGRDLAVGGGSIRSWIGRGGREVGGRPSLCLLDAELRLLRVCALPLSLRGEKAEAGAAASGLDLGRVRGREGRRPFHSLSDSSSSLFPSLLLASGSSSPASSRRPQVRVNEFASSAPFMSLSNRAQSTIGRSSYEMRQRRAERTGEGVADLANKAVGLSGSFRQWLDVRTGNLLLEGFGMPLFERWDMKKWRSGCCMQSL
ncbi:uncharacterized protein [Triticum aestivum]|uniref:uncharacterized protein n=1 Tax=Triticum aestivum TaxID=4565 RepID=UPI001D02C671|nr:uncharacterized protein LOC123157723 [Triticum aestivum]